MVSELRATLGDLFDRSCHLLKPISQTFRLDAEILFEQLCGVQKHHLISDRERLCLPEFVEKIETAVQRRVSGEPIAYIVGWRWFYKHKFMVTPAVLVPRPETELLVEWVLKRHATHPINSLLDMCTGSGCVGISIGAEIEIPHIILSDISVDALAITTQNIHNILPKNTISLQSNLYENILERFDVITVNPPYLTQKDMKKRDISVQHEPEMALDGGKDGLLLIGNILKNAPRFLNKNGVLIMEIGAGQLPGIRPLIPADLKLIEIIKDYAHIERHLVFCLSSS